jgi:hypothetical protein
MAIETDEDRLAFVDPDEFGATATFTLNGGAVLTDVPGIYDDPNVTKGLRQNNQFSYSQGQDVSGDKPEFHCLTSAIPGVKNGRATVVIGGENFSVFNVQHDGTGMTCVRLMRA